MIPILVTLAGCSSAKPPAVKPDVATPARLAEADRLVRAGCLDCLLEAFGIYDDARARPAARQAATIGAIRTAGLIALREREIGHVDQGFLRKARDLFAASPGLPESLGVLLDIADTMPTTGAGTTRTPTSDLDLERMTRLRRNTESWGVQLRESAAADDFSAYVYLSFACATTPPQTGTRDDLAAPTGALKTTALVAFRRAICRSSDMPALAALLASDPRFLEVKFFQALVAVSEAPRLGLARKFDEASALLDELYAWRPEWPALTNAIGNLAMTAEEFAKAITYYSHTLDLEPRAVDALIGKIKALTYMGRPLEAIETADQLLAQNWFVGDARYWRALNLSELDRQDEAWADIEAADKLVVNADVPKLAGLIAYRRQQVPVARDKFELALRRNKDDCETHFYLGLMLAELSVWERTAEVLANTAKCLQANEERYLLEIATIRASEDPPARKENKIKRREQYIAKGRRQMATSFYNVAVASFNLRRTAEAREYAEKVADDEQFGARAKEILSRIK